VRDLDLAVAFYRDTLGVLFLFQAPPKMAFFDCGGVRLLIGELADGRPVQTGSTLHFASDDIQKYYVRLVAAGVAFKPPPQMIAHLIDRDLASRVRRSRGQHALMAEPLI
jgi:methylmalonyl-CoA/ethylmalonyl-CoA epimerase